MAFLFYFVAMAFINVNGKMVPADLPVLTADNRGYRYGDGLFETIKVKEGEVQLNQLHFERMFSGAALLQYELPAFITAASLEEEINALCRKNNCEKLARVRLSVYRGSGGLYDGDNKAGYIIECWPLEERLTRLNENGLVIDIFQDAAKGCDVFANLKSTSLMTYVMATQYAKKNKLNDALILNVHGRIADSTIANVFIMKNGIISTPALSEGCIAGVMRKHLLDQISRVGYKVSETTITFQDVLNADEVFLTNAIRGVRWVRQCRDKKYTNNITTEISHLVHKCSGY
jgi:branched-chain amino acid aminotransferase